jgi:hypothetical protein
MKTNSLDDKKIPNTFSRMKFRVRNNQFVYRYILNNKFRVSKHILFENDKLDEIVSELFKCGISVRKIEDVLGQTKGLDILDKSLTWIQSNEKNLEQNKIKKFLWTYFPTGSNRELDLYNQELDLSKILGPNIFISPKIENLEEFDATNQQNQFLLPPSSEGIIIKTNNNKLIKLQTKSYQFAKSIGTEKNIFIGLIHLYQKDYDFYLYHYKTGISKYHSKTKKLFLSIF